MTLWTDHIREFAKTHNISYACAMTEPNCKASYQAKRPQKLNKKEKKENESMGAEEPTGEANKVLHKKAEHKKRVVAVKAKLNKKLTEKELKDKYPAFAENKQMGAEDKDIPAPPSRVPTSAKATKKKVGRPKKYATEAEAKEAKKIKTIESNKRRALEKKESGKGVCQSNDKVEPTIPPTPPIVVPALPPPPPPRRGQVAPISNLPHPPRKGKGMKGGATSKQKGISAEIRGRLENIPSHDRYAIKMKDQLSNIIHSADLNPKSSNPYKDITNLYDPKAEETIQTALKLLAPEAVNAILKPHAPKAPAKPRGRPAKKLTPTKVGLPNRPLSGTGLEVCNKVEGDNGLTHIYPLTHNHILRMLQ